MRNSDSCIFYVARADKGSLQVVDGTVREWFVWSVNIVVYLVNHWHTETFVSDKQLQKTSSSGRQRSGKPPVREVPVEATHVSSVRSADKSAYRWTYHLPNGKTAVHKMWEKCLFFTGFKLRTHASQVIIANMTLLRMSSMRLTMLSSSHCT
jgi:hypothetical protein